MSNFYQLSAYLKYRRKAKGRHGVHSPFVYKLVEECLISKSGGVLEERLAVYFKDWHIRDAGNTNVNDWLLFYRDALNTHQLNLILRFPDIHRSPARHLVWQQLSQQKEVKLSIDLFHFGLLFFNPDFKEQEHFVLKFRK